MNTDQIIADLGARFGSGALRIEKRSPRRIYVDIYPKDLVAFARYLFLDLKFRFNCASAVDDFDCFEILYHFTSDASGVVVSLRVIVKEKADAEVDTLTDFMNAAWWIEREMHELFGIKFRNNDDLRRLLLPDDWPNGVYPMRKDFIVPKRDSRESRARLKDMEGGDE